MMSPTTHYADNGGCSIAYQVIGDGPVDVLFVPGLMSHLDLQWGDPLFAGYLQQLASHARLIVMDQRGVGLSDRTATIPTIDARVGDVAAVADAVGAKQPIVIGHCHGGPAAIVYAASHPERVAGLILMSTFAKGVPDKGHPGALTEEVLTIWEHAVAHWGEGHSLRLFCPSRHEGALYRKLYATFERAALSPGMARAAVASTREIDISAALGSVSAPTLVVHCAEDFVPVASARYLAAAIPNARLAVLPGADHVPFAGADAHDVAATVIGFIRTCQPVAKAPRSRFAAVLMTDIVDSTGAAAHLGDSRWVATLAGHDAAVREHIDRNRGECLKFTGDGYLAIFRACEDALECAGVLRRTAREFGLSVRCGVHVGDYQPFGEDVIGMTVMIASRLMSHSGADTILVSDTARTAVAGAGYRFSTSKPLKLKGITENFSAAELLGPDNTPPTGTWRPVATHPGDDRQKVSRLAIASATRFPRFAHVLTLVSRPGFLQRLWGPISS